MTRLPLTLALVAALFASVAPAAQAQWTPKPYFSPNGGGADATATLIDEARESIDIAMYSISTSGPIWDALRRAVQRGVKVRIVLNSATRSSARSKVQALQGIGVHVFGVTRTMHQKFALFDAGLWYRRKLVNGSANWSRGAEVSYSENTVVFGRHYHLFYAFQEEFNRLLADARPVSAGAENFQAPVSLNAPSSKTRRYEEAFFSGLNDNGSTLVSDEIVRVMRTAQTSIFVDVAHFNSTTIANALIDLRQTRPALKIEVMVDLGEYADGKSRVTELEAAGIEVRYKTYSLAWLHPRSQLQHHKTLIVDERDVVTGSYNWSDTAENSNYENTISIKGHVSRNRELVQAFVDEHRRLWTQDRDRYPALVQALTAKAGEAGYQRVIPIHFDTDYFRAAMALTRPELEIIRRAGYENGLFDRQPNGKRNSEFSYLDRETKSVFHGNPSGTLIPVTPGLSGAVNSAAGQ